MPELKDNIDNIKQKVIEHIRSNYDETKSNEFIDNINSMNDEEFVAFLKEQGMIKEGGGKAQCIFCSIVFGDIPSTKIGENEKAVAILDINPASLGHTLVIPKEHIESSDKMPGEAGKLAIEVKEKLERTFNPKKVDMVSSNVMGHEIINVLPVYKEESLNSERKKLKPEELEKIKEKIETPPKEEAPKEEERPLPEKKEEDGEDEINEKNTWLPKRIP